MSVNSSLTFRTEDKYFASTDGSSIQQLILQTYPGFTATAVDFATRKSKSRSFQVVPVTGGYEHVERCGMREAAQRVAEEAVEHLAAPSVEPGTKDLVLLPSHLGLTIHESIGHSTELDRALGYEANFAGTSFVAPPEKVMGKLQVGSPLVNVIGDRTLPGAMSTVGYDDDGVKATSWHILKDGVFQAYQTTRDQAHLVGETASRGCCYADSFDSIPFQRMPNVWLEPGTDGLSLDDLIGKVDDGILIDGRGSYSIDQQRYNFQFGGDAFWEIKGGKTRPDARRRGVPEQDDRLLGRLRGDRRPAVLAERGPEERRQGPAGPDERDEPRVLAHAVPRDPRAADGVTAMLPSEKECRRIVERALGFARVDDAAVSLTFERGSNTRFANNEITTSGATESLSVVLSATRESRTGRVSLNEMSDAALERAMHRAEELAGLLPADPEYVGPLPKQKYPKIAAWDEATARTGAAARVPGVRAVVEPAARDGLSSSGFFTNEGSVQCVANKAGNFGWHRSTDASFSATVRTADGTGSGWAEDASHRIADVDAGALAARALQKARDSANPRRLEPGDYTVILEPAAVAGLFGFGLTLALSARAAEEGRSYFSKKGGGTLVGEQAVPRVRDAALGSARCATAGIALGRWRWWWWRRWGRRRAARRGTDHLDRQGRADEPVVRPLLGAQERPCAEAAPLESRARGRNGDDRVARRVDRARPARDELLVHPGGQSADAPAHRADARRRLARRGREDPLPRRELPLQREPGRRPAERRRDDEGGAPGQRRAAGDQGHELHVLEPERRRVSRGMGSGLESSGRGCHDPEIRDLTPPMYELFDHTADVGLRMRATDLECLFRDAAEGLFSLVADSVQPGAAAPTIEIDVRGDRADLLLFDWLSELLYVSDRDRVLLCDFTVSLVQGGLRGRARAVPIADVMHRLQHEVKAITYHGLRVERADGELARRGDRRYLTRRGARADGQAGVPRTARAGQTSAAGAFRRSYKPGMRVDGLIYADER